MLSKRNKHWILCFFISQIILINKFEYVEGAFSSSLDNMMWNITSNPVIFGSTAELSCYIADENMPCTQKLRQWIGGQQFISLCQNMKCSDDTKYHIKVEKPCSYKLMINNFSMYDVNCDYSCFYGTKSYRKHLQLNSKDFVSVPGMKNTHLTVSQGKIDIQVYMEDVYPIPKCSVLVGGKNITQYLQVMTTEKGYFYDVALDVMNIVNPCRGNVTIYCLLGNQKLCVLNQYIGDCTDLTITQPNDTTIDSGNAGNVAGILIGLVVAVTAVLVAFCVWKKRVKRNSHRGSCTEEEMSIFLKNEGLTDKEKSKHDQNDIIPKSIRDKIDTTLEEWIKRDLMFVTTRASSYVRECLQDNNCVTVTAPSGVGKSFIARHTALILQKKGYTVIPVNSPTDIKYYYRPGKQIVFIVDDMCGNFTANQQQIEEWSQLLPLINKIISDTCCKIIVACRLQVYTDEKFTKLSPFFSCECNLISDKLCYTVDEKMEIAKMYLGTNAQRIDEDGNHWEFFPLLCCYYHEHKDVDVNEFFRNPYVFYKNELDSLWLNGDEGKHKVVSLALCVMFNNQLKEKWFQFESSYEQKNIISSTLEACRLNRRTSKAMLKKTLDTLEGTFIRKQNGIYRTIHDKLFDFLVYYFGQTMIKCLIDHGDGDLVHDRFIWHKSLNKSNMKEFNIEIPDAYLNSYLGRFVMDWSAGKVKAAFNNNNMNVPSFEQQLLKYLQQLDKPQQVALANTRDTVTPMGECGSGTTPLICTCNNSNTDIVQWILHNDVDVDQCRDDGITGLLMASQNGYTDLVKLLLVRNPNVDLCDKDGCSPIWMASQNGHIEIVKILLEKNPNVNLCDNNGYSPVRQASEKGHTYIVKILLERNPNVDLCDKDGCSPLYMASQNGHTEIVKLLLERNPKVDQGDKDGRSPLCIASQNGHTAIVKLLLERYPNVDLCDKDGCSPLCMASQNGQTKIVQLIIERNPNVDSCDKNGYSPLRQASQDGHTDIVKILLKRNPNVDLCDKDGCSPLFMASQNGHTESVKLLLERNLNVDLCDKNGRSPLCMASQKGHTDVVKLLLKKSLNVDQFDKDGCSPVFMASQNGHTDIVKLLLEKNPNVDLCDKDGCSPLCMASQNGHTEIVNLLLERNSNVDLCDKNGRSPLRMASQNEHTDIVKLLLERNPNVDLCDKDGCSPVFMASQNGHTEIVNLLLEMNSNVDLCDKNGRSPLCMASQNGHTDLVKVLLERNSNVDL